MIGQFEPLEPARRYTIWAHRTKSSVRAGHAPFRSARRVVVPTVTRLG